MTKNTRSLSSLPPDVTNALSRVGESIRIARKRRGMTLDGMASRMFVTRKTLARLEKGDPSVSLGVLASALWVLGMEKDLLEIALPEKDEVGNFRDRQRLPKRVRPGKPGNDLDF